MRTSNSATQSRRNGLARRGHGLTLLEVLLAVAIIGVLAAIAVPNYSAYVERGRVTQALADIRLIKNTIGRFSFLNNGQFSALLAQIGVTAVDSWGNAYQYLNAITTPIRGPVRKDRSLNPINTDYDLYSMGPDRLSVPPLTARASRDDIVRGRNRQFVGPAEDF